MNNTAPTAEIMTIINACESVILATCDKEYPDVRHMTNAMNRDATSPTLYFMTSRDTPKYVQLTHNPMCTLYYFDERTRHAVRLYGVMEFVHDMTVRTKYWHPDYNKFGYGGPDSPDFILMQFVPHSYKFYIGTEIKSGKI